ncbi:MAG: NAD(P)/FAD-dependent oxidoreductase [Candidatus Thorarchaeota archaeon]|nr:NAD(P)/FAD-dependent oxidoreductase [Candidatus Thorarchaeota archaeon]
MTDYDVLIVGGGPAGSTAARRTATAGLRVLLLDKAVFPRSKPCAGAIRGRVRDLLDFEIGDTVHRKISGLSVTSPQGLRIDCVPEDRSKPGYTVMREEFDTLLLKKAEESGAEVRQGTAALDIAETAQEVTVVTEAGETITASFVVGADGINSTVARQLGFYSGWPGESACVAIEMEVEVGAEKVRSICGEPGGYDADLIFLSFGAVPYGYTWCFPKRTALSMGICCRQDKARSVRSVYDRWFSKFCEAHEIEPVILSESSARFPLRPSSTIVKGRALLVGDAAGFVDAFTGEGIPYAIESGIAAAAALNRASGSRNPHILHEYEALCKQTILKDLAVSRSLADMFYKSARNMDVLCRFFHEDQYARYLLAASIGGLLPMSTVKRKMTLRLLRTRPRDVLSLTR